VGGLIDSRNTSLVPFSGATLQVPVVITDRREKKEPMKSCEYEMTKRETLHSVRFPSTVAFGKMLTCWSKVAWKWWDGCVAAVYVCVFTTKRIVLLVCRTR